ncbi:MAG: thiol:disulfide interchange protein DsbA/DsbL [Rhodanobacteraceae bacterium]
MRKASNLVCAALLACGLLLTAACSAQNDNANPDTAAPAATEPATAVKFTQGNEYVRIGRPAGQTAPTGRVQVVEVFSYGCPHCAEFAPYMDKLRTQLPAGVEVSYMPAIFNASWVPYAQAYYAAVQLGVFKQTHDALFKAMLERYPLNNLQDLAAFYARHGVDQKKFLAAATDAETTRQMAADQKTELAWGIDATPTLVVGRRASNAADAPFVAEMRSNRIDSYEQLQQVGLWMAENVDKE